jgi:hypothetical protein
VYAVQTGNTELARYDDYAIQKEKIYKNKTEKSQKEPFAKSTITLDHDHLIIKISCARAPQQASLKLLKQELSQEWG